MGIAKRLMVNIKNDTIRWMFAKMKVRRSLTPNLRNFDVLGMLKFSLWNPDIFPKDAFDELKKKYPGRASLDSVLDIAPKLPEDMAKQLEDKFQNIGTKGQGFNQPFPQRNKGNTRGGRNRPKPKNGQNPPAQWRSTPQPQSGYKHQNNQNKGPRRPRKGGKTFQKGKQEDTA